MDHKKLSKPLRIAIFSTEDIVWGLTTWKKALPVLLEEHNIVGIYLFPERLARLEGMGIPFWYLRVFGFWTFVLLGLFALKQYLLTWESPIRNWQQLARHHGVPLHRADSPNAEEVVRWSKENEIDVIIIMIDQILKEEVINTARLGVINKHASLLPGCRGIFPFFWARLTGAPTGITFHEVDTGIDTGRIVLQVKYPTDSTTISMIKFYIDGLAMYPNLLNLTIRMLIEGQAVKVLQDLPSSYYSLPTREDYRGFRRKGFQIIRFSDLFYTPSKNLAEVMNGVCRD